MVQVAFVVIVDTTGTVMKYTNAKQEVPGIEHRQRSFGGEGEADPPPVEDTKVDKGAGK